MQTALNSSHYKKIWERVVMNRHPEAKSLEEALKKELKYFDCFFQYENILSYVGKKTQNLKNEIKYYNAMEEEFAKGLLWKEKKEFYNAKQDYQILGRPITLEDILTILPKPSTDHGTDYLELSMRIFKEVLHINGNGIFYFTWQLTKPLHEQPPETLGKIADLI